MDSSAWGAVWSVLAALVGGLISLVILHGWRRMWAATKEFFVQLSAVLVTGMMIATIGRGAYKITSGPQKGKWSSPAQDRLARPDLTETEDLIEQAVTNEWIDIDRLVALAERRAEQEAPTGWRLVPDTPEPPRAPQIDEQPPTTAEEEMASVGAVEVDEAPSADDWDEPTHIAETDDEVVEASSHSAIAGRRNYLITLPDGTQRYLRDTTFNAAQEYLRRIAAEKNDA